MSVDITEIALQLARLETRLDALEKRQDEDRGDFRRIVKEAIGEVRKLVEKLAEGIEKVSDKVMALQIKAATISAVTSLLILGVGWLIKFYK